MARLVNQNSEFIREPGLLIPGGMPIGPVKLDPTHDIIKDIHSSYIWNSLQPRDLTGNVPDSAISVAGSTIGLDETLGGQALVWEGEDSNQVDIADDGEAYEFHNASDGEYSILHRFIYAGSESSDEYTLSCSAGSTGLSGIDVVVSIEDGLPHNLLFVRNKHTDLGYVYLDGEFIGSYAHAATSGGMHLIRYQSNINTMEMTWGSAASTDLMIGGTPQKESDRWEGAILFSTFWQRALEDEESKSVTADPYQFLIPA